MTLLAGFLEVFCRALVFIGLSLGVGGIVFYHAVLRRQALGDGIGGMVLRRAASLVGAGAFLAAAAQMLALVTAPWALADEAGRWPLDAFLATGYARAGMIHAAFGLCLGCAGLRLRRRPRSPGVWGMAALLAAEVMASGAWLVHGASRLEHSAALMTVTVLHQLGAAAWIGGTMHLTAQWLLLRRSPEGELLWPQLPPRFSPLAMGSVALLLAAAGYLSWHYVGGPGGLIGTAYGAMVATKAALMGCALFLGGMNFLTIRHWKETGEREGLFRRIPYFAETEAGIGTAILMAAASLASLPPAVDTLVERATPAEVFRVFAPKLPQLTSAPLAEMLAGASSSLDPFSLPTALQKIQSNFNHNVSGIFVILMGAAALLDRTTGRRPFRHWPLLFLPFALFLLVFAEPTGWPLGREGFWETLAAPEVLQHRLATLLVVGLGLFEWRVRVGPLAETRWRYAFPLLCGVGGALLLSHAHSVFAVKWAFLIEVSHNAIGFLAVLMGAGRWLELRLPGREGRAAGLVWPVCFMLVGVVLLFYRET